MDHEGMQLARLAMIAGELGGRYVSKHDEVERYDGGLRSEYHSLVRALREVAPTHPLLVTLRHAPQPMECVGAVGGIGEPAPRRKRARRGK